MKKLRSINWYYLAGTLPFVLAITVMTAMLADKGWMKILIAAAGAGAMIWVIRKFRYLPRREKEYGKMKPCSLTLPVTVNADIFLCPNMDRYEFLKREVEIISPLWKRPRENFKIAVSPKLYENEGSRFTQIAVMREIIRYRQASQVKASLGLITPVLFLVSLVEGYFALGWSRRFPIAPGYLNFFGPLAVALVSIAFLLIWNKNMSRIDYRVDDELKQYFPKEEITAYIKRWDELLQPKEPELVNEKSRQLEEYYMNQRIERL